MIQAMILDHIHYAHNLVYEQKSDYIDDLSKSISTLENIIKDKVRFYRAPGFSIKSKRFILS